MVELAENYGQPTEKGADIFNIPFQDLADVTDISLEETTKIMDKIMSKGWMNIDEEKQMIHLLNLKHLNHLSSQ